MKNSWKCAATAFSAAALLGGLHSAAHADVTFTLSSDFSNAPTVNVSGNNYAVGRYFATIDGVNENVFCVDFNQHISGGDSYTADISQGLTYNAGPLNTPPSPYYYQGGLASALSLAPGHVDYAPSFPSFTPTAQQRADEAAYLSDTYLNNNSLTNTQYSAIQISIWDIIQDGGDGLTTGQITADSSFASLVSGYETAAAGFANTRSTTADWIQAPRTDSSNPQNHSQEFVFETGTIGTTGNPVPEPGPLAMLASLGGAIACLLAKRFRARTIA